MISQEFGNTGRRCDNLLHCHSAGVPFLSQITNISLIGRPTLHIGIWYTLRSLRPEVESGLKRGDTP